MSQAYGGARAPGSRARNPALDRRAVADRGLHEARQGRGMAFRSQASPSTTGSRSTRCARRGAHDRAALSRRRATRSPRSRGRDDVVLGIATGKSQRGVRLVLGHHGLLDHFITIKTADDAPSKPDPGMVLAAMREAGVERGRHGRGRRHGLRHRDGARRGRGRDRRDVGLSSRALRLTAAGAFAVIDAFADSGADARQNLDTVTHEVASRSLPQFRRMCSARVNDLRHAPVGMA